MYVAEDKQYDEGSEDGLHQFEEDVHGVSDLAEESTVCDQVDLIEDRDLSSGLDFYWFKLVVLDKVVELGGVVERFEAEHFFIMLGFCLFVALTLTKVLSLSDTHHVQVELRGVHKLGAFIALCLEMLICFLCSTLIDTAAVD